MGPMTDDAPYGFQGRLRPEFPSQVVIDVTESCNLACVHCPHPAFKLSEHYAGRRLDPELNRKLVTEVRETGGDHCRYLRYTGNGEPLLHPQAFDMLGDAASRSGTIVCLTTNGMLLDERRVERLVDTGVDLVDISIDAFSDDVYARIRRKGDLAVTRAGVQRLLGRIRDRSAPTRVVVSYVEQPENRHETDEFERFWRSEGAHEVVIRRLHSAAGAVAEHAGTLTDLASSSQRRPCLYPWERITLNARGWLAFCPQDWEHGSEVADYRTTSIADTWRGSVYQKLRRAHLDDDYSHHRFCGQCPDWQLTRWPSQGRSYADMVAEFANGDGDADPAGSAHPPDDDR
jgi:MoaA/NifB/PqqE/SkfB family radical SAM enzyme